MTPSRIRRNALQFTGIAFKELMRAHGQPKDVRAEAEIIRMAVRLGYGMAMEYEDMPTAALERSARPLPPDVET